MRAELVDTSRWQGKVDAAAIKAAGFCGIVARCTTGFSGSNQPDPFYLGTQAAALELGMIFGAYHLLVPSNRSPKEEAKAFLRHVGQAHLYVLDTELRSGLDPHEVVDQCWTWLQAVEQLSGRRPIVYTGSWFWDGASYVGAATPAGWEKDYDLWEAEYTLQLPRGGVETSQAPIGNPGDLSDGFVGWKFWQWTSSGRPFGVQSQSLDFDVFNGSEEELRAYLGMGPKPQTLEERVAMLETEARANGWGI